jgi:hypothetical protein
MHHLHLGLLDSEQSEHEQKMTPKKHFISFAFKGYHMHKLFPNLNAAPSPASPPVTFFQVRSLMENTWSDCLKDVSYRRDIDRLVTVNDYCERSEQHASKGERPGQTSTKCFHALSAEF